MSKRQQTRDNTQKALDVCSGRTTILAVYRDDATGSVYSTLNGDGRELVAALAGIVDQISDGAHIPLPHFMMSLYARVEFMRKEASDHE